MIAGVSSVIGSGMKMSVFGPEMIMGVASIIISLAEKVVSLTGLIADGVPIIVSESSMTANDENSLQRAGVDRVRLKFCLPFHAAV